MGGESAGQEIKEVSQGKRKDLSFQKLCDVSPSIEGKQQTLFRRWDCPTASPSL